MCALAAGAIENNLTRFMKGAVIWLARMLTQRPCARTHYIIIANARGEISCLLLLVPACDRDLIAGE